MRHRGTAALCAVAALCLVGFAPFAIADLRVARERSARADVQKPRNEKRPKAPMRLRIAEAPGSDTFVDTMPAGVNRDDRLLSLGYLDVTKPPYSADRRGAADATAALQRAVEDGRDHQLVVFLPEGTYRVSDTIHAVMETDPLENCRRTRRWLPTRIVGSQAGERPRIVLTDNAAGFGAGTEKAVLFFQAEGEVDTDQGCNRMAPFDAAHDANAPSNYNHLLRNVEIDVGERNPGAIGLRMGASQGAMLEDVSIDATGGYAGIRDLPGQGGGSYNVEVTGGDFGVDLTQDSRFPLMVGFRFVGQRRSAVQFAHYQPLVIAGSHFDLPSGVVGIAMRTAADSRRRTTLSTSVAVIDSVFAGRGGNVAVANPDRANVYLRNVQVSPMRVVVNGAAGRSATHASRIDEYAYSNPERSIIVVDGQSRGSELRQTTDIGNLATYDDVRSRHTWSKLPSFEDSDVAVATDYGVVADGITDTTVALQRLIDQREKVFLPKGIYRVTGLTLRENTQLFGIARNYTILGGIESPTGGRALVDTVDSASGRGRLSSMHLLLGAADGPGRSALEWRLGAGSAVHAVTVDSLDGGQVPKAVKVFWIHGSGGGRWYGVNEDLPEFSATPEFRSLYVDGTQQPLAIYAANFERLRTDPEPMAEVANASNVSFYYVKTESGMHPNRMTGRYHYAPTLRVRDSTNVGLYALFGNANLSQGRGIVELQNSTDVVLAQVGTMADPKRHGRPLDWNTITEKSGAGQSRVPYDRMVTVYERTGGSRKTRGHD